VNPLNDSTKLQELTVRFRDRIDDILEKLEDVELLAKGGNRSIIEGCFLGTLGLIDSLYGPTSPQTKAFLELKKIFSKTQYSAFYEIKQLGDSVKGILLNIREEIDAGLITSIASEVAGEVIGDLLSLAKAELNAGYLQVAAVLASAALEDAMKRKAQYIGINVQGKTLENIINQLKAKSFFKGAQVPIVSSYVKLRNAAMHADWQKIQGADVSSLIGFLEPFLIEHFS
jgi:hypothetical protein